MTLTAILIYLGLVLAIGAFSHRLLRQTGEDYFIAGRSIGPFVLLMTLFGTHMTSFALLGSAAQSYRVGIGVFALMASSSALVVPVVFFFVGIRVWAVGKQHGFLTQVQYFRERWQSDALGLLLFIVLVALLIPYLLIGVMGGGITLHQITGGEIPEWVGSLLISVVIMMYVSYGGLRGTAWVNTFQTLVFMSLGVLTFFVIVHRLGGLEVAIQKVAEQHPALLVRGQNIRPLELLTYTLIPLSVGMFPHIFMHWLSAKRAEAFRSSVILYPLCIAVVWIPSVVLGVLGSVDFPGLEGPASNAILVRMIAQHAPDYLAGLLGAGVFAAIMSSVDSQSLSLGTMFTQDIVRHYGFHDQMSEERQILVGRLFVGAVILFTFVLSLVSNRSIFGLAIWSFTGFAALLPVVVAALFWRRSTAAGAIASVLSVVVLWLYFFVRGWGSSGDSVAGTGIMPVAVLLLVSSLTMVAVSLLTEAPEREVLHKFFPPRGEVVTSQEAAS